MSARDTGETAVSPSGPPADPPPARPSWDVGSRPAAPPRAAPAPAPVEAPPKPYYAAAPPPPAPAAPPAAAPAYQAEEIKYDLSGNPIASKSAPPAPAYAPPPQVGYPTGATTSWPPPAGGPAAYGGGPRNTSGEGGDVPPEVARLSWNWGAFFFPVMWCRKHGLAAEANILRYSFLAIVVLRIATQGSVPIVFAILGILYGVAYSGARIYFALKGPQMAWRSRHFPGGVQEYFQVQKAWMWWGFGISVVWAFILPVLFFLGMLGAVLSTRHHPGYPSRYGGSNNYGGYSRPANPGPNSGSSPASPSQGGN